ncbi:MAG: YbhB/YbcL family Raf kinase inhibitor-like protein [Thermoplasmatota archaeon]
MGPHLPRAALIAAVVVLGGCVAPPTRAHGSANDSSGSSAANAFLLESPAFASGESLPKEVTCDGRGTSPPLSIRDAPNRTISVAIEVVDPDAPIPVDAVRSPFTHWILWNTPLDRGTATFRPGAVPNGTIQGTNSNGTIGYEPPCPPVGSPQHRYVFEALALDVRLNLSTSAQRADLDSALRGHVLANATLMGLYARPLPALANGL